MFLEDKLSLLLQSCSLLFSDDSLLIKESLVSLVYMDTLKVMKKIEQNCDVIWPKDSLLIWTIWAPSTVSKINSFLCVLFILQKGLMSLQLWKKWNSKERQRLFLSCLPNKGYIKWPEMSKILHLFSLEKGLSQRGRKQVLEAQLPHQTNIMGLLNLWAFHQFLPSTSWHFLILFCILSYI